MKILHTSDLHIGKRVNEYSMLDEKEYILNQIVNIAKTEQPDAIILAGDIYDKPIPAADAVTLYDNFLVNLARLGKSIFIISGNHDSAERISFANRIMEISKVYVAPVYDGKFTPIILNDGKNDVAFYMLPYVKPAIVQHYTDNEIKTYDDAVRYAISQMDIDKSRKNVLITHQFITDAQRTESEDTIVGGLDNIGVSAFDDFDYVALGHLHRPQYCGKETIRYSGSPLKYSFSEVDDTKSVSIIDIDDTGVKVSKRPLTPLHEWHDLKGKYAELTSKAFYEGKGYQEDYVRITLTDDDDILDAMKRLQTIYHKLVDLQYDNKRTRAGLVEIDKPTNLKSPYELFAELFKQQNGADLSDEQTKYLNEMIDKVFNNS